MSSGSSSTLATQPATAQGLPVPWPTRGIHRLPVELVAEIILFSVPTDYDDPEWARLGKGRRNIKRVRAPFRLASVSRLWRDIALTHTPAIWSYICLPEPTTWRFGDDAETFLGLLLERSKRAPLSVLLPWDALNFQWPGEKPNVVPESAKGVFIALAEHAERWRRVEYHAPGGGLSGSILSHLFTKRTPLLTELHVSNRFRFMQEEGPVIYVNSPAGLLPESPRLEVSQLGLEHFVFSTPIASLVDLLVDSPLIHANLWAILQCTPNLKALRLDCTYGRLGGDFQLDRDEEMALNPIVLPSLALLQIRSALLSRALARAAVYTRMPNLTELHLPHQLIWAPRHQERITDFLKANGSALTHLCIWENHPFDFFEHYGEDCDWDAFWKRMSAQPWLAPKLETLSLRDLVHVPNESPGFIQFHNVRMSGRNAVSSFRVNWVASQHAARSRNYYLCKQLYSLTSTPDEWHVLFPAGAPAIMVTAKPRQKRTATSYLKPKFPSTDGVGHPYYDFIDSYMTPAP